MKKEKKDMMTEQRVQYEESILKLYLVCTF